PCRRCRESTRQRVGDRQGFSARARGASRRCLLGWPISAPRRRTLLLFLRVGKRNSQSSVPATDAGRDAKPHLPTLVRCMAKNAPTVLAWLSRFERNRP